MKYLLIHENCTTYSYFYKNPELLLYLTQKLERNKCYTCIEKASF